MEESRKFGETSELYFRHRSTQNIQKNGQKIIVSDAKTAKQFMKSNILSNNSQLA